MNTDGPILELGAGINSTPFLHFACIDSGRKLVTYEGDEWFFNEYVAQFGADFHKVVFAKNWDEINLDGHWSVALIDHDPKERRIEEIKRLQNTCDYLVIHDTQGRENRKYRFDLIWSLFKYRMDWTTLRPCTTILSNFYDPAKLYE